MFFSAQRRRVAHAFQASPFRDGLKGAKKSLKARFARSASPPARFSSIPEVTESTCPSAESAEVSAPSSLAQTTSAVAAASLDSDPASAVIPPSYQSAPPLIRIDTSAPVTPQLPDTCNLKLASTIEEETPQAVASLAVPTPDNVKVEPLPSPSPCTVNSEVLTRSTPAYKPNHRLLLALHPCTRHLPPTVPLNASPRLWPTQKYRRHMSRALVSSPHLKSPEPTMPPPRRLLSANACEISRRTPLRC